MVSQPTTANPRTSQGHVEAGTTTKGTRSRTQTNTNENRRTSQEENTKTGDAVKSVEGEVHEDTPEMPGKSSGALDTEKNKNIEKKKNVSRMLSARRGVRDREKKESVEERRGSGRGRKDPTEVPIGAGRILKDSHWIQKKKEEEEEVKEEEELDFAAIERKIFEGQEEILGLRKDNKDDSILDEKKSRTAMKRQEKGRGRSKEEEEKAKEEEELDFAAIERKIFEGRETTSSSEKRSGSKQNDSVLGGKRRRTTVIKEEKEEKRRINKGDEAKEDKEGKITKNTPGNVQKIFKKEEEEEEEESKESRRGMKREVSKEKLTKEHVKKSVKKEEKEEKPTKTSLKVEKEGRRTEKEGIRTEKEGNKTGKEGIKTEKEGKTTKQNLNDMKKRESLREERGKHSPLSPPGGKKRVRKQEEEKERKKKRTETPEKRTTDMQKGEKKREDEENEKRKREGSRERRRSNITSNKQTEKHGDNVKQKRKQKTTETSNKRQMKRNKNKEEKEGEEERRKSRRGKQEERGRGKNRGGKGGKKMPATASDSEMSDWEEVGEMEGVDEVKELLSQDPSSSLQGEEGGGGVRIELDAPEVLWGMRKRKKKRTEEELIEDYLRRKVNKTIREVTQNAHKVHLLCLLAHGRHLNAALGSGTLLGAALSTTPGRDAHPPGRMDLTHLQRLVTWFGKKFPRCSQDLEMNYWEKPVKEVLVKRFGAGEMRSVRETVLCFVVLCRALGIGARLVIAFQPLPWKPAPGALIKPAKEEGEPSAKSDLKHSSSSSSSSCSLPSSSSKNKDLKPTSSSSSSSSSHSSKKLDSEQWKKSNATKSNRKMLSSDSETSPLDRKRRRGRGGGGGGKRRKVEDEVEEDEEEEDSDFKPRNTKFRKAPNKTAKRRTSQEGKRKKEGEAAEGKKKRTDGMVEWVEVFVEEEEKWVCVDVVRGKIHCVAEIAARMPPGSAYITAFNPDLTVKDVTLRYVSSWLSSEKKLRCCSEWWSESLRPFRGRRSARDKEEDEEMEQALHLQPLPKTMTEYKNHPLYALQRHLLKFEAIYPPDVSPAGFFKGEPVYPRSSVHNLHSRDTWMKEAKSVRVDEEPYKTVKARPKWDRVTCQVIKDRPLELFGEWQVEDYEPPVASNGKVPRNEYGNVELFKPSMLPRGCVHIPVSGINRLARKLNIDCAPAMVGFDFHSGWTHPVYDGYVVCEEFKDVLMDAWNQEQEEQARRAEEKRQKRVYDNWKKLIKGILVRERVRQEYQVTEEEEEEEEEEERKRKDKKNKDKDSAYKSSIDDAGNRRKVKQADIDALENENKETGDREEENDPSSPHHCPRPPLITHQVRNLSIDLTSNVVEMAQKSRQRTMKTKNSVRRPVAKGVRKRMEGGQGKVKRGQAEGEKGKEGQEAVAGLSEESEESDEEAKKEKIRAILSWSHGSHGTDPDLSDDSDGDNDGDGDRKDGQSSSPFLGFSDPPGSKKLTQNVAKRKRTNGEKNGSRTETETDYSSSSSRSTTPEPDVAVPDGPRRLSLRSTKRRVRTYKEEEAGESEGNISLDDSDFEDKSYNPLKK